MDEDGLPIVGSGVDLTKVPAIQQKRVVAFLNQFIVHTVRFLNRFSTVWSRDCHGRGGVSADTGVSRR